MIEKKCIGCGEILQSIDSNKKGYLPTEKLMLEENPICKRCFRLKNYGEIPKEINDKEEYQKLAKEIIKKVDVVLAIFDVIDLEASMTTEILDLLEDKKSIIILNKMDLLPKYFSTTEIAKWFSEKIIDENIFPEAFCYISSKTKYGVNGILRKIRNIAYNNDKKNIKLAVLGASNVGKSSLLNNLMGKNKLTVSKFSGTTKSSIKNTISYKDIKITFIDTPGLIPNGRLGDFLESKKSVLLVPNKEISRKTFKLKEGQVFMFSNLIYFKVKEKCEIQVFASKNIEFHVTNEEKVEKLLNSDFFKLLNEEERKKYYENEFIKEDIFVEKGKDLVISGLGFITIKKNNLDIEMTYPKGLNIVDRESISKEKRVLNEEEELW